LHVLAVDSIIDIMHNEALWGIMERLEALWKHYGCPSVAEHYGRLQSIVGRHGTLWECYAALAERYGTVTENIHFANH